MIFPKPAAVLYSVCCLAKAKRRVKLAFAPGSKMARPIERSWVCELCRETCQLVIAAPGNGLPS